MSNKSHKWGVVSPAPAELKRHRGNAARQLSGAKHRGGLRVTGIHKEDDLSLKANSVPQ